MSKRLVVSSLLTLVLGLALAMPASAGCSAAYGGTAIYTTTLTSQAACVDFASIDVWNGTGAGGSVSVSMNSLIEDGKVDCQGSTGGRLFSHTAIGRSQVETCGLTTVAAGAMQVFGVVGPPAGSGEHTVVTVLWLGAGAIPPNVVMTVSYSNGEVTRHTLERQACM